jgi:hypothetical protein
MKEYREHLYYETGSLMIERSHVTDELESLRHRILLLEASERALKQENGRLKLYIDLMSSDISNWNSRAVGYIELALESLAQGPKCDEVVAGALKKSMVSIERSSKLIINVWACLKELEDADPSR